MRLLLLAILCAFVWLPRYTLEYIDEEKTEVKVGAIFFKGEDDVELSFDEAFREINSMKLFEVRFETVKRFVPFDDSFVLQQLTCELISDGVVAIFGPSSKASSDIVAVIANSTGIPHLEYDWKMEHRLRDQLNRRLTVSVAPTYTAVGRAYWDVIRTNYKWKSFTIIYETDDGLARLQDLMNIRTLDSDSIKVRKISHYQNDYRVLWKEVQETFHETRIVLDCSPSLLEPLLNVSLQFNLLDDFKNWFFTHLDTHSSRLKDIYNESFKANITAVRIRVVDTNPYERKKTRITRIDEIYGNQTMLPILMYDAVVLFANSARNVITSMRDYRGHHRRCETGRMRRSPWMVGEKIVGEMKTISEDDVEPHFKTQDMRINEFGQRAAFNLEIYKPTVDEPLALWKPDNTVEPIELRKEQKATANTQDFSFSKKLFTIVTHVEKPYFMFKNDSENYRGLEKYEGYAVDLIARLGDMLQFDYDFMIVSGNGKYDPATKEWDGIIRKLIDHQAQIGISDLTITQKRREVVDFTVPFMQLGISILYYKSPAEPKNIFAFLQPFANDVWIYMILTQLVMTLMFEFMARISNPEWESPIPYILDPDEIENKWNTSNSFWLMIGSIMQQGCDMLPRGLPMRILNGMWWFFALMMLSTYTANLAAFLTSNKMQSTIKNLEDLVDQDKVKYGTVTGGSTSLFFSETNDTIYHKAWNQMRMFKPSAFTVSNKEGVERVLNSKGDYAFLMETTSMSYNIQRNCDLMSIGSQIGEKHYGLAVPLGAEYRSNLSYAILQLSEKGELANLKRKWWEKNSAQCELPHEVDGDELSIIELGGVFLVLGGGIFVAMVIGICEFLWNVQQVAVKERITPYEAFKAELMFVMKFWIQRKPLHISTGSSKSSLAASRRSSAQSRAHSRSSAKKSKAGS